MPLRESTRNKPSTTDQVEPIASRLRKTNAKSSHVDAEQLDAEKLEDVNTESEEPLEDVNTESKEPLELEGISLSCAVHNTHTCTSGSIIKGM